MLDIRLPADPAAEADRHRPCRHRRRRPGEARGVVLPRHLAAQHLHAPAQQVRLALGAQPRVAEEGQHAMALPPLREATEGGEHAGDAT
ncbi:hypothetical protein [Siccirubricoccus sp. G192]|uniref:hypothetical protein n=1 Tax=Siccirubricoccus sp. G192 TaxID=2849651 RepID=UPI0020C31115|nr:hypothetical protein [Siccirubricoccus sp. G192]